MSGERQYHSNPYLRGEVVSGRDANQLAADEPKGAATLYRLTDELPAKYRNEAILAIRDLVALVGTLQQRADEEFGRAERWKSVATESEAQVGTLQQERDEARLDALMAHKAAEIHSDKAVAAEAALAGAEAQSSSWQTEAERRTEERDDLRAALADTRQALAEIVSLPDQTEHYHEADVAIAIARRALAAAGGGTEQEPA